MDILVAVFLFIVSFVVTLIGVPRRNETSIKATTFLGLGGLLFILTGVFFLIDPIETIAGVFTVENVTGVITEINSTFEFSPVNTDFNNTLGIAVVFIGIVSIFFGAMAYPSKDQSQ